jgi:hypothetical protein
VKSSALLSPGNGGETGLTPCPISNEPKPSDTGQWEHCPRKRPAQLAVPAKAMAVSGGDDTHRPSIHPIFNTEENLILPIIEGILSHRQFIVGFQDHGYQLVHAKTMS